MDTIKDFKDRSNAELAAKGKRMAARLAEAVTEFLRTDPDTRLALAHIFEADGPELRADIERVIEAELLGKPRPSEDRPQ